MSNVERILTVVVFPAPLCPSNAHTDPVGTEKLTSRRAGTLPPNVLATLLSSITESYDTAAVDYVRPTVAGRTWAVKWVVAGTAAPVRGGDKTRHATRPELSERTHRLGTL